jgi:hypothetical protein
MTTTQSNSDRLPSVMELMVEIKKYWTTATGEPELKEFAEYVQEIIQSRDRQLEQRVLEALNHHNSEPTSCRAAHQVQEDVPG